jgi:hypothetical protein
MARFCLLVIVLLFYNLQNTVAQETNEIIKKNDSLYFIQEKLHLRSSVLFSNKSIGLQVGIGKNLVHKELHKIKNQSKEKITTKDKILSLDVGYYYQPGLHHHWFLTGAFHIKRTGQKGFYTEFSPLLGVSRTFLSDEKYEVNSAGVVTQKKLAGNWYVTSGFSVGGGKTFAENKNCFFKDVHLKLFTQVFYPQFGFVVIKPSLQIGTSVRMEHLQRFSKHIIKYKYK